MERYKQVVTNASFGCTLHDYFSFVLQRQLDRECSQRLQGALAVVTAGVLRSLQASHEGKAEEAHKQYIASLE